MARKIINIGVSPGDGSGESLRSGGQKINENFVELYAGINNRVFKQSIGLAINHNNPIEPQIASWLNNTSVLSPSDIYDIGLSNGSIPYNIKSSDIVLFATAKITTAGVENSVYGFRKGAGSYGVNGTDTVTANDFEFLFKTITNVSDSDINKTIELGEIGTTDIWTAVRNAGAFDLNQGTVYIFRALRDEEPVDYYYIGQQGISVGGLNGYPTNENDYIDLTNTEPSAPDLSSYVTFSDLDISLYDSAEYNIVDVIDNANPGGEPFVLYEETDGNYFFGSKTDNVEDFKNCRLYLRRFHFDFPETPDLVQNGYNFYDLGVNSSQANITPVNGYAAFTFWRKVGGTEDTTIELVDNLLSDATDKAPTANQVRILKGFIDAINEILVSDDTTLDEIQEIVAYIKQNKEDLQSLSIPNIAGLVDALAGKAGINDERFHTHANKAILDAISQSKVDKWDTGVSREVKIVNATTQYTVKLEDWKTKKVGFTANNGEEIQVIFPDGVVPDTNAFAEFLSLGNHRLNFVQGNSGQNTTLTPTRGNKLNTVGKGSIVGVKPGSSITDLYFFGTLEYDMVDENQGYLDVDPSGGTVTIPHGLEFEPTYIDFLFSSSGNGLEDRSVSVDDTNITITFNTPPTISSVRVYWQAKN